MSKTPTFAGGTPDKPAAAPHGWVPNPNELHEMMDMCKRSLAYVEEKIPEIEAKLGKDPTDFATRSIAEEFAEMRGVLKTNEERLGNLDKHTGRDDKFWQAEEDIITRGYGHPGWYTAAYKEYGKVFGVSFRSYRNGYKIDPRDKGTPFDTEEMGKRAADQHGEADAAGMVLVPEQVITRVGYIMKEKSLPRLLSTVVPMVTDTARSPVLDSGPLVYYAGQGAGPSANSKLTFSKQMLEAKTLMALNIVALELSEDSAVAYEPFWATVFTDSFAVKENKAMISENPANDNEEFEGIILAVQTRQADQVYYLGGAANSGKKDLTQAGAITYDDVVQMETSTDENTWDGALYFVNRRALRFIRALRSTTGEPIYHSSYSALGSLLPKPDPKTARATSLLGDQCYVTGAMPSGIDVAGTPILVRANPQYHFWGDRMGMGIKWSSEAGFADGALVMRARERYASKTIMTPAFAILSTATS